MTEPMYSGSPLWMPLKSASVSNARGMPSALRTLFRFARVSIPKRGMNRWTVERRGRRRVLVEPLGPLRLQVDRIDEEEPRAAGHIRLTQELRNPLRRPVADPAVDRCPRRLVICLVIDQPKPGTERSAQGV